jgi:hypothetical protein
MLKPLQPTNKGNVVFDGPYLYGSGVYFGQYENKLRSGWGKFFFSNGAFYEGEWERDGISGFGRLIKNGGYYEGGIVEGKAHGKGRYEDATRVFEGEWRNDKRSGEGREEFKKKMRRYQGGFADNKYNGIGTLITE